MPAMNNESIDDIDIDATTRTTTRMADMMIDLSWFYAIYAIQMIGPVAIKFCQWVATRRDIFPPELCNRLSKLHDKGYPHSWTYTHKTLQQAFGDDYQTTGGLVVMPEDVIGCGSAAQVYRGKLRIQQQQQQQQHTQYANQSRQSSLPLSDTTIYRDVAVKVLHPNFQELVDRDLELIGILADFLHSLPIESVRLLNLPHAVEDFSVVLHNQSDLTIEATNLRRFRKNFYDKQSPSSQRKSAREEGDDFNESSWGVVFPQPVDGWTSSKVLVEDYVHDSVPIADFLLDSSKEGMETRRELAGTYW